MSEYNNFNGYEIKEPEKTPSEPTAAAPEGGKGSAPDYRSVTQATDSSGVRKSRLSSYGVVSILGAVPPLGCCCYGVSALIGLIVGLVGLKKDKGNPLCIVGVILCASCIAYWIYSIVYTINHPEEFMEAYEMYSQMLSEMENSGGFFRR